MADPSHVIAAASVKCCNSKQIILAAMKSQREQSQKIDLHLLVRLQQCQHVLSKSRSLRVANGAGHKATSKWAGRHRDKHPGGCRTALWRTKHHRQQLPAGWASTPGNQRVSPGCCCRVVRELQARGQQCLCASSLCVLRIPFVYGPKT